MHVPASVPVIAGDLLTRRGFLAALGVGGAVAGTRAARGAPCDLVVDAAFPGGNIVVERIDGETVFVHQDLRDTPRFWFYWYFRVRGAAGRRLTFQFTRGNVFGARGPAVSIDRGDTWRWLGAGAVQDDRFEYAFAPLDDEVRFCFTIPYVASNLAAFLRAHHDHPHLRIEELGRTAKGRGVELLRAGDPGRQPRHRVLVAARHHACEAMASYAVEGLIAAVLADSDDGRWLRNSTEFWIVPFVDKDGVEEGDQGKLRDPYDHWLDYEGDSRYVEVRRLRDAFERDPERRLTVALDIHCPYIRDTTIYFAGGPSPRNQAQTERLCNLLEQVQSGPLRYAAQSNMPFGTGWNTPATYGDRKSFALWAEQLPGNRVAATVELPYASVADAAVTATSARTFGSDLSCALRQFLDDEPPRTGGGE